MNRLDAKHGRFTVSELTNILLCLYFVLSLAEPYLNSIIGSVTKYYIFLLMFVILYRDGFKLNLRKISIVYMVWLGFKLLSLLWSQDFTVPKLHFISQFGMVAFLVILLSKSIDEKTLHTVLDVYCLSSIALGVLAIFFSKTYLDINEARQVLVIMGVEIDPNNQAALLLIGVAISASNILYQKRRIVLSTIGLLINIYACFATASRGALVTLLAMLVFCVFYSNKEKRRIRDLIYRIFFVAVGIGLIYVIASRFLPEASFRRLFDFESYEGGSDRDRLWSIVWQNVTSHPLTLLIGTGWGTVYKYLQGMAVHNTFLTFLSDTGIVGTVLFLAPMALAAVKLLKRKKPEPVLLLIAQMVPSFFIDAINKRFFWNAVIVLFLYYYMSPEKQLESHEEPVEKAVSKGIL